MTRSRWERLPDGTRILYQDFRDFGRDVAALRAEVEAVDREICSQPPNSVLALADMTGTATPIEVVWLFKHSAAATRGYLRKQAVVGLTGVQRVLVQAVARFSGEPMHVFDTRELATAWLGGEGSDDNRPVTGQRPSRSA
jgi:hypothetical protein